MDDAKEAVQEYIKASGTDMTYKDLQLGLISDNVGLWLIATERSLVNIFTNLDLQGNTGKKYSISFRFSDRPSRPREAEGWPNDREEILSRLDDAGEVVDSGLSLCYNCGEVGHITKACPQEKLERTDRPKISCYNCGADGHRVRDCKWWSVLLFVASLKGVIRPRASSRQVCLQELRVSVQSISNHSCLAH